MILLSSSLNSFIQLLGVLLIFLFVLVITYFTTKWIGGYQKVQMSGRSFQVVDTIRIANNKLVQVIKMGDVYLVIAERIQTELGQGQVECGRAQAERLPASALIFWFRGVFFLFHVGQRPARGRPAESVGHLHRREQVLFQILPLRRHQQLAKSLFKRRLWHF